MGFVIGPQHGINPALVTVALGLHSFQYIGVEPLQVAGVLLLVPFIHGVSLLDCVYTCTKSSTSFPEKTRKKLPLDRMLESGKSERMPSGPGPLCRYRGRWPRRLHPRPCYDSDSNTRVCFAGPGRNGVGAPRAQAA
jgi:hypothetical protein